MKLTNNEKKVLRLLIKNAKITDSSIAEKLKISSQAVGKIRKKLEGSLIDSYSIKLNYGKLGIKIFAIAHAKITPEGMDKGELEVEQKLIKEPHVIEVYRLPSGSATHIILYGFKDMFEMDNFFHSPNKRKDIHNFIENKDVYTFSNHSLLKSDPMQLFNKVIDELETESTELRFLEIENFKKRILQ